MTTSDGWRTKWLSAAMAMGMLVGCGGGNGGSVDATTTQAQSTATIQPGVVQLTAAQTEQVVQASHTVVEFKSGTSYKSGDVLVIDGMAVKLGEIQSVEPGSSNTRFAAVKPELQELYSSIVIDGEINDALITSTSQIDAGRIGPLAYERKWTCKRKANGENGLAGTECEFELKDDAYKNKSGEATTVFKGSVGVGVKGFFKTWDAISNSGSGELLIQISGGFSLPLNRELGKIGSLAGGQEGEACSTALPINQWTGSRVLLASINLPINGVVSVRVPLCISAGAKANLSLDLISYKIDTLMKVKVGNQKAPEIEVLPSALSAGEPEDNSPFEISESMGEFGRVSATGEAEIGGEISVELGAFGLAYTGVQGAVVAQGKISAEAAALRAGVTSTVRDMKVGTDVCISPKLSVDLLAYYYAQVPAFAKSIGLSGGGKKQIIDYKYYEREWKWGGCSQVDPVITVPELIKDWYAGELNELAVSVGPDPGNLYFPTAQHGSGVVTFSDFDTGEMLCAASLDGKTGQGKCRAVFKNEGRRHIVAIYGGDKNFRSGRSRVVEHTVLPQPDFLVQVRDRKEVSPDIVCNSIQLLAGGQWILGDVDSCYTHVVPQIICTGPGCAYVRVFPFLYVFTETFDSFGGPINPLSPECVNPLVTVVANGQPEQPEYSATASGWFVPPTDWGKFARTWENMYIYKKFVPRVPPQEYGYCHATGLNLKYAVAVYSLLTKDYKIIRGEISR